MGVWMLEYPVPRKQIDTGADSVWGGGRPNASGNIQRNLISV